MENEIEKNKTTIVQREQITPMSLIAIAQGQNADIEKMQQLFELQMKWEENQSRKAYNDAISAFKSEAISLKKDGGVGYYTKNKEFVGYKFATLANIVDTVVPLMSKHGISHSWETKQDSGIVSIKCKLSHRDGHSESIVLSAPPDTSGKKNNIQSIGSTVSYLQRYTLTSILGLAAGEQDDDGGSAGRDPSMYVSDKQAADITALITELNIDEQDFLNWLGFPSVEDISANKFTAAIKALEGRRAKK